MPTLRIALAQDNPVVGDLDRNAELIRSAATAATAAGAHLLATGEQSLTGYPVEDLALRHSFVEASRERLARLAEEIAADGNGALPVAVGYLDADGSVPANIGAVGGRGIRNALALIQDGKVLFRYYKRHFPNYGVFDEERYFVPGHELHLARIGGVDVAFTICEDVWGGVPITAAAQARAGLVVNVNASPYEQGKQERRRALVEQRAAEAGAPIAYLNIVGGQDELVFDGGSFITAADGKLLASGRRFGSELLVADLELAAAGEGDLANHSATEMSTVLHVLSEEPAAVETRIEPPFAPELDRLEEIWEALRLGLG
ncbi:MAG: NAD+ synthase, partial [Glycomyces artemisiae]|nr:NAD+ synthase [Glycomyces artemisiae]